MEKRQSKRVQQIADLNDILKFSYNIKNKFIEGHIKNDMRYLRATSHITPQDILNLKEKVMDVNFIKKVDSKIKKLQDIDKQKSLS